MIQDEVFYEQASLHAYVRVVCVTRYIIPPLLNLLDIKRWLAFYSVQPYLAHPLFIIVFFRFQHTQL